MNPGAVGLYTTQGKVILDVTYHDHVGYVYECDRQGYEEMGVHTTHLLFAASWPLVKDIDTHVSAHQYTMTYEIEVFNKLFINNHKE